MYLWEKCGCFRVRLEILELCDCNNFSYSGFFSLWRPVVFSPVLEFPRKFFVFIFLYICSLCWVVREYWGQFPNNWYQSSGLEEVSVREFLVCSVVAALSELPHQKIIISWSYWRRSRVRGFLVCFVVAALCDPPHQKRIFLRHWYDVKVFKCNEVRCREIWWKNQFWLW